MTRQAIQQITDTVSALYQDAGSPAVKLAGAGAAVILSAVWDAFTGTVAVALVGVFLADVILGVLKAIHQEGIEGFDLNRLARGFIKLCAAAVGIALMRLGDVLMHQAGGPEEWFPFTTAFLAGATWGFFWSGVKNLSYFFPAVTEWIDAARKRGHSVQLPDPPTTGD